MTLLVVALAVTLLATVLLFLQHLRNIEAGYTAERRELLNRIAHPERIITPAGEPPEIPDREHDGWTEVGSVRVTDEWLKADD